MSKQDKRVLGRSRETPREADTNAEQHCIRESLFAPGADVSPRSPTGSTISVGEHLIRASSFAAVKTGTTNPNQQETQQRAERVPPLQRKGTTLPALPAAMSKQAKYVTKRARKMSNRRERLQTAKNYSPTRRRMRIISI